MMRGRSRYTAGAMSDKKVRSTSPAPTPSDLVGLYRRAFAEFGSRALWNVEQYDDPSVGQILAITRQLRIEGNLAARALAEQIEQATRADH